MKIEVYTDGSATVATKPGGWAWVLVIDGKKHSEGFGHMEKATNNDAEMEAAIQGLAAAYKFMSGPELTSYAMTAPGPLGNPEVTLCSDSQIILGWADGRHRFKQAAKIKKYEVLRELMRRLGAKTRHVYGHTGDEYNERCDKLANLGRKGLELEQKAEREIKANTKIGTKKDGVMSIWYRGTLKVVDLQSNVVEDFNKEVHGKRDSKLEVR